mgnify:CR=1 FL=1
MRDSFGFPVRSCCAFLAILFVWADLGAAADLYVAADGDDGFSGKLPVVNAARTDGPLATLEAARDAVRKLKAAGLTEPVTVHVRGGLYELRRTLKLSPEDSGTAKAPVVYRAYQGERPVLIGGRRLTAFVPHQGQILKADLAKQGLKGVYFRQLIFDGQRQHLARYPNFDPANPYGGGWAYVDGKVVSMYQDIPGENRHTLVYRAQDARRWSRPTEGEIFVFPRYNWWNNIVRIKSIDPAKRQITLAGDASYPIRAGDRYYVQNLFEELDSPGEWYLDRETWTLYFWPPAPLADCPVYVPTLRTILELGPGTSHVTFRGFTFECCEGTAIVLKGTQDCLIAGCTIRNVGDYHGSGVSVEDGQRNGVVGNDISFTGSHGITLSGGDRKTLAPADNYADNNYIHHMGVFYKQGVGVMLHGVGNRASHNLIHDGPRMGIMFIGNNLLIEYNHIRHVNLETEDTGAVYTGGRDWISSRGTVIRYNYFHDILGYGRQQDRWISPHFAWGIYLDDNAGGVDVIGNIVVRAARAGLHLHNGRDNLIENNIFVENRLEQIECNGWTREHRYWKNHLKTMIEGYEMVAGQPAWQKMRNMHLHPKDAVLPDGTIMAGNVFQRNIIYYRDPQAKLFTFRNMALDRYQSDYNLIWHFGQPLLTGQQMVGRSLSENLVPNARFDEGELGALPKDWSWQTQPAPTAKAGLVKDPATGARQLRIEGACATDAKGNNQYPVVVSSQFPAKPGHYYRLTARMKSLKADAKAALMLQSYVPNVHFWANWPHEVRVGTDWRVHETVFKIPGPGERGYHEQMKTFRVRVDYREADGALLVAAVSLEAVEMLDEWAAWRARGLDQHSLVADPKFVDPEKDDYRLQPDSPAFQLGFQPIPVEKIGPYQHELRASWPIVEAEGAREKPLASQ